MSDPHTYNRIQIETGSLRMRHVTRLTEHWQATHGLTADGMCGPKTRNSLHRAGAYPVSPLLEQWIKVAREELGRGETVGNNAGPDIDRYRFGRTRGSWCAWFLSWCLHDACGRLGFDLPIKLTGGAKRLYRRVGRAGSFAEHPRLGAVACWDRGARGSWQGHVGLVAAVDGGLFTCIEGNRGRYPSKVREYQHEVGEGRLLGFAVLG